MQFYRSRSRPNSLWIWEGNRWTFVIDLKSWAIPLRVSNDDVEIFCFTIGRYL